ncbi:glycerophosphodiester phosphodiesterase [Macrococcus armenti]|uniref:Glycerophosphodiester phosphodiesterase n=1 Tax=Macrococcus armenti TaxID=2875764 RepID=A0ABY3ZT75_9STAP|nr:glycerophosphodiester phosphodiesterase [Macrococcus armenti]UOB19702.1 glycerophosphodiester phosphodiesterase [Macrococcus armenti]
MTLIFAHRGYSAKYPENSMLAFKQAVIHGADGFELDIHLTKDNQIVVIHDDSINRTTNGRGKVQHMTYDEIKQYRIKSGLFKVIDEPVPLLEEVLNIVRDYNLLLNIEIKAESGKIELVLHELLEKYSMNDRIIISSFNIENLIMMESIDSDYETALLFDKYHKSPWDFKTKNNIKSIHPNAKHIKVDHLIELHEHELPTRVYTVNKEKDLAMWINSSVAGIITDEVERAVKLKQVKKRD